MNQIKFGEIMLTEEAIQKRVKELGAQITKDYEGEEIFVICILRGACFFTTDLLKRIENNVIIDFMAVTSYGSETKTSGVVKIIKDLDTPIDEKHVLIIEDIVDTGLTLHYLMDNLKTRNPKSLKICTLLDKPERRKIDIEADYTGFVVDNRFIVGYGLDYQQKYRNLPYITCLEEV